MSTARQCLEIGFGLGANLGDRRAALAEARRRLVAWPGARLLASSALYETDPVGVRPEYAGLPFLNAVVVLEAPWDAAGWLAAVHEIEQALGRRRTADRFAPRTVDVDVLYAGDECLDDGGLVVPHPRWMQRRFVVAPLAEVRPDLRLPGAPGTVREILAGLPPEPRAARLDEPW